MTYLQTFKLAHDPDFRARVQVAAYLVGRDIANDGGGQGDAHTPPGILRDFPSPDRGRRPNAPKE